MQQRLEPPPSFNSGRDILVQAGKMNDPHVATLHYAIEHHPSVDYGKAKPLDHRESAFDIRVESKHVRFTMNEYHATPKEAREAVEEFIRTWEFNAALENGPNAFKLRFDGAEVEDRNPTPGTVSLRAKPLTTTVTMSKPTLVVSPPSYPSPPSSGLSISPDVQSMYDRLAGYREGREPITSMTYFGLTVLKASTGPKSRSDKDVGRYYRIHPRVLRELGRLSSTKGGAGARKACGVDHDLKPQEKVFLEEIIKAIIRRSAEVARDSGTPRAEITLSDFPDI